MELILGLSPMSQYDAAAKPMYACFTKKPDFSVYEAKSNQISLTMRNTIDDYWSKLSYSFDLEKEDHADCVDDGVHCNGVEGCVDRACVSSGDPCNDRTTCDETLDACVGCAVDNDCDDGLGCTTGETCAAGVCSPPVINCTGATPVCDANSGTCVCSSSTSCQSAERAGNDGADDDGDNEGEAREHRGHGPSEAVGSGPNKP